jgi:hypothetical protein
MKRKVTAIINIVKDMPEYTQGSIIGGMAYSAINQEKFTSKKISEVVSQLRDLRSEYNGSEVQSNLMEKKVEFIQTLEAQHESLVEYMSIVKEAYKEVTGSDYIMPAKQAYSRNTETQAAADADAILSKY